MVARSLAQTMATALAHGNYLSGKRGAEAHRATAGAKRCRWRGCLADAIQAGVPRGVSSPGTRTTASPQPQTAAGPPFAPRFGAVRPLASLATRTRRLGLVWGWPTEAPVRDLS
jgi:hypothetical protein